MIHVLVAFTEETAAADFVGCRSSVEVLLARGAEEAVEKLARNRRIDAVLLVAGAENARIVAAIREDNLALPPLFLCASAPELSGARRLASDDAGRLLDLVAEALSG